MSISTAQEPEILADGSPSPNPHRANLVVKPVVSKTRVLTRDAEGRLLYCVIGNYFVRRGKRLIPTWTKEKYVTATDQASAIYQFRAHFWHIQTFRHVLAAPAVGFFVHDNHGDVLSSSGARPDRDPEDEHAT